MPYQLLKYLASVSGPTVLRDPDDIQRVALLKSAELVESDIPPTIYFQSGHIVYSGAAVIHRVTDAGRRLANRSDPNP
jgi:hypothetical protein